MMSYIAIIIFEGTVQFFSIAYLKKLFGHEETYIQELENIIYEVIDEYKSTYGLKSNIHKFPFYESRILFEYLVERVLLGKKSDWDEDQLKEEISKNENIEIPTQDELEYFFSLLAQEISNSKKLKGLYVEENFKQEIFSISDNLKDLKKQVEKGFDDLKDLIKNQSTNEIPILSEEYIARGEEQKSAKILEEEGVLLLTGISFCGKSQLAKKISLKYYQEGFLYKNTSDLKEADRFLRATNKTRILILEDPFGHSLSSERNDGWRVLEEAIKNKPPSNKLIVTSKLEVLKSTKRFKTLEDCKINNNEWVDVTNTDPEFLEECWNNFCAQNSVPNDVREKVLDYLGKTEKDILQVGQLRHLANISKEKIQGESIDQLLHLARTDSRSIAIEIDERGEDCSKLFLALGLTTKTNQPSHLDDLKFILSDTDVLPGFLKQTNDEFTFSSTEIGDSKPDFPKYPDGIQFTPEQRAQLKFLQKRGFISIKSNQVWFNHPTYREAARHLFFLGDIINSDNLNLFINRSLATLTPESSICCAQQIRFIYDNFENQDIEKVILDYAFRGVQKSIFPGVRDKLFAFILDNIDEFSDDNQEEIFRQLEYDFDANDIYWQDDIAYLGPRKMIFPGEYEKKTEDLKQILEDINHQQAKISSIWSYVVGLQYNRIQKLPNRKGIIRVLNVNEVFIRKRFALLIFEKSFPSDDILATVFSDEHPSVISSAIKGAIIGCPQYTESQREKIANYINKALEDPHVVIRSNKFYDFV